MLGLRASAVHPLASELIGLASERGVSGPVTGEEEDAGEALVQFFTFASDTHKA